MADLTAIILTKDEEKNISACLESLRGFASRVVVVDSGSTDNTTEIAKRFGADVLSHPYSYYAAQFNWGLENAGIRTTWVLRIDADERFTPELCAECEEILEKAGSNVNGVAMDADFYFLGRLMKHGIANKRKIMIFRYGFGSLEDRKRDPHTIITCGEYASAKNHFQHYDFKDLNHYVEKYNWYTIRETQDYFAYKAGASQDVNTEKRLRKHRKHKFSVYYRAPKFFRCFCWFCYNYYFRLGFLDGREGYIYHWLECYWYRFLVDAKIYEREKNGSGDEELKGL